jgi:hypothetical protein
MVEDRDRIVGKTFSIFSKSTGTCEMELLPPPLFILVVTIFFSNKISLLFHPFTQLMKIFLT